MPDFSISIDNGIAKGSFRCMASPCEVLIDCEDSELAREITGMAVTEATRIESKFSRYRDNNLIYQINHSANQFVDLDGETDRLIEFAFECYTLSEGLFDITSGILQKIWRFDGKHSIPTQGQVDELLPLIGLNLVSYNKKRLKLPAGMQIDLGGIGKEYAVDRIAGLIRDQFETGVLVNLGGDIAVTRERNDGCHWHVGIEDPDRSQQASSLLKISRGAIATSGDARRYIMHRGKRYGHILNPRTGWPVEQSPRSVTVAAGTCTDAGIIATLAMLQGEYAEEFLERQGLKFYCHR
jgi:thiamine biosynthesis lipoprotein